MDIGNRIVKKAGMVAVTLSIVAGPALFDVGPASAHETSERVGDAVGTVGAAHSGARICELSPGRPGIGRIKVVTGDLFIDTLSVSDGCKTEQYAFHNGIVQYQVGWDQGGGTVWGPLQFNP